MGHLTDGVYEAAMKLYSLKPAFHVKNENRRNITGQLCHVWPFYKYRVTRRINAKIWRQNFAKFAASMECRAEPTGAGDFTRWFAK